MSFPNRTWGREASHSPKCIIPLGGLLLLVLVSGCNTFTSTPRVSVPGHAVEDLGAQSDTTSPAPLLSPTPVLALANIPEPSQAQPQYVKPSLVPEPLRFTFPTAGPEPISGWRPPLYPTPWEPTPHDHFYFTRPIGADEVNWPLAKYRYGGVFFADEAHTGVDIPAPIGTPVLAAGSGKVVWAGYGLYDRGNPLEDPYGLSIAIKHDFGYKGEALYTVYGHMDQIVRFRGQLVEGGEMIGMVGETGKVTGPHLHFEVRIGDNNFFVSRNPELWISPPQGWGILAARVMGNSGELLEQHRVRIHSYDTNQYWYVITYGRGTVNPDPYYRENMVIGDLPAGNYEIWIDYEETIINYDIYIEPGMVTFFTFLGSKGYDMEPPPTQDPGFIPPDFTPSPSPTP